MNPGAALTLASAAFLERVAQLAGPDWTRPTPCEGLDVQGVVNHVVAGNLFAVRLLKGSSAVAALDGLDGDLLGTAPLQVARGSCDEQTAAFESVLDLDSVFVHHPAGDITVREFFRFRLGDLTVHSWDVARGAGLDEQLDSSLVAALWILVQPATTWMASTGSFGDGASVTLDDEASPQTRLLDAFGRRQI